MALMRLDSIITATGKKSRREAKQLIREGRILVDGKPASVPEQKVDPEKSAILMDGEDLGYRKFTYVLLNKPAGLLTATEDKRAETVMSLLPEELRFRLFPVGRLDKDTEGLLLLTDDGVLAHRLLAPKFHVDKTYYAKVEGALTQEDVEAFARGITLGDGLVCRRAGLTLLSPTEALVTVQEGKFHQVKRMLASRGKGVTYLRRIAMGPLTLGNDLPVGQYRFLTETEETKICKAAEGSADR